MRDTYVVFCYERVECLEFRGKVGAESIGHRSDEITSRRNQYGIILGLIFWCLFLRILIGVLLADGLLFENFLCYRTELAVICMLQLAWLLW
jgi:hypothetical protein